MKLCYDCEKITRRCKEPGCHLPEFYLTRGEFVGPDGPTWHVWMDIDGSRFRIDNEFTASQVETHFGINPNADEDAYYDEMAQSQEDWDAMVDTVSNRGIMEMRDGK